MNDEAYFISGSFVLLSCSLSMLLLLLTYLQSAYVFRASVQPPAIQTLLPCSIQMLAYNYLSWFSYPFPKRLRHFLLFLSYHMCFPHTYSKFTATTIQHATTACVTAAIWEQSFLELLWKHKHCWRNFLGNVAPHLQPGGTPPEAAITMPCFLSH